MFEHEFMISRNFIHTVQRIYPHIPLIITLTPSCSIIDMSPKIGKYLFVISRIKLHLGHNFSNSFKMRNGIFITSD